MCGRMPACTQWATVELFAACFIRQALGLCSKRWDASLSARWLYSGSDKIQPRDLLLHLFCCKKRKEKKMQQWKCKALNIKNDPKPNMFSSNIVKNKEKNIHTQRGNILSLYPRATYSSDVRLILSMRGYRGWSSCQLTRVNNFLIHTCRRFKSHLTCIECGSKQEHPEATHTSRPWLEMEPSHCEVTNPVFFFVLSTWCWYLRVYNWYQKGLPFTSLNKQLRIPGTF